MVGTARSPEACAAGVGIGTGRKRRSSCRAPSGALGKGEAAALLLELVTTVALLAKTLGKVLEPLVDRKVDEKGTVAREGGAAGGGPPPPRGDGMPPPGLAPPAAAKVAHSSPSRRARNARRAKAHRSAKNGDRRVGNGEPAPRPPTEEEAGLPPPPPLTAPPGETAAPPAAPGEPPATAAQAAAPTTTTISTAGEGEPAVRLKRARAQDVEHIPRSKSRLPPRPYPPVRSRLHRSTARAGLKPAIFVSYVPLDSNL
jgi:hypothetical protein